MKPEETVFHEITLQDKAWMDQKFAEDDRNVCEYSFANNFARSMNFLLLCISSHFANLA